MSLEAVLPALEGEENPVLLDFQRRFVWTLPLSSAVMLLAMLGHRLQWFEMGSQSWIELALSLPVVLWTGWPFFLRAFQSVVSRSPNMWTLIGLGTGAVFVYGCMRPWRRRSFRPPFRSWVGSRCISRLTPSSFR